MIIYTFLETFFTTRTIGVMKTMKCGTWRCAQSAQTRRRLFYASLVLCPYIMSIHRL